MAKVNLPDAVKADLDAMRETAETEIVEVVFDLEAFTAGNVDAFLAANRLNDVGKITKSIVPLILSCPKEWGPPDKVETYEKLPMATWKQLTQYSAEIINYITSKN